MLLFSNAKLYLGNKSFEGSSLDAYGTLKLWLKFENKQKIE